MIMRLELVVRKDVSRVELVKDDRYPLGITIRDGIGDEAGPVIKKIKAKSLAERSYAFAEGDVILSVNGRDVMGARGKDVQWMIKEISPTLSLQVQYEMREASLSRSGIYRKKQMATRLQKVNGSFGFVLRKKDSSHASVVEYPLISNIKQGSPADKDGLMQDGDRLLKVDDVSLSWLSLADIAVVLQGKDEAEFTFEYSIRVEVPEEREVDLTIDAPQTDLGIGICTHPVISHEMCIGSIRMGSIAERCGVFRKGDIILSVNGIDVEFLTVSKANALLKYARENRRISFISTRGEELTSVTLYRKSGAVKLKNTVTSVSSFGTQTTDHKYMNTTSSNSTVVTERKINMSSSVREQMETIKAFQDIRKQIMGLKQCLSQLTREAFDDKNPTSVLNDMCTYCNTTHHSIKLCASCLSKINVDCAQCTDGVKNLIAHFIKVSISSKDSQSKEDARNQSESGVSRNLIYSLTKTLPDIFSSKPDLKKSFKDLAEKISSADRTCICCENDINYVSITVQKLLLLISLNDNSAEIQSLISKVLRMLLNIKFACDNDGIASLVNECKSETPCSDPPVLSSEDGTRPSENAPNLPQNSIHLNSSESESNNSEQTETDNLTDKTLVLNPFNQSTYYRNSDINHSSENINNRNDILEMNTINFDDSKPPIGNDKRTEMNVFENSAAFLNGKPFIGNNKRSERKIFQKSAALVDCKPLIVNDERPEVNVFRTSAAPVTAKPVTGNDKRADINALENSAAFMNAEVASKKNMYKDKSTGPSVPKVWRSLDSCLNVESPFRVHYIVNKNRSNESLDGNTRSVGEGNQFATEVSFNNTEPHLSAMQEPYPSLRSYMTDSESNTDSAPSIQRNVTPNSSSTALKKTRRETVDVKLVNNGEGFGFVLGYSSFNFKQTLPVPVITAIKPKSPAERVGVLQKKDRVLAVNHQSLLNMPLKELESLKRQVSNSQHVILTIEFDVDDVPLKCGIFDVVLEGNLKTGLYFQGVKSQENGKCIASVGIKKGYPLVVSGVLKGSAAYRSGQVFPSDKVTFITYSRKEEFDPVIDNYTKQYTVTITVQRHPDEGVQASPSRSLELHTNPFSFIPRSGVNFVVKRTSFRAVEGSESLLLEQEVTLFRDPVTWDFGFLVGENPETGRAYITDIKPGGPASTSGVVKKYDRILKVNGIPIGNSEDRSVLSLLTQANDKVDLLIRRFYHGEMSRATRKASRH